MRPTLDIKRFYRVSEPITDLVTKFGGQPYWLAEPQWPISRAWGRPMRFICQIRLEPLIFGSITGQVAYVFVTHASHGSDFFDPDICSPDDGENAIIVQPDGIYTGATKPLLRGPTLYWRSGRPAELAVELEAGNDPDFLPVEKRSALSETDRRAYAAALQRSKIGGTPFFFQGDAQPTGTECLLLQLNPHNLPCYLNLGASPLAYAFLSTDGSWGKMLIQDT